MPVEAQRGVDLPFLHQLDAVALGELELKPVLVAFLTALEANMAEFEGILVGRPEARVKSLVRLLETAHQRFQDCHGLVWDVLDDPRPGDLARLRQSHARLDQALASFHAACWVHRGPTCWAWANRIAESLERFLQGESMDPGLSALLDGLVLSFERRGAARVGGPARELLFLLRPLADWARGSILLGPTNLREALADLPEAAELAGGYGGNR